MFKGIKNWVIGIFILFALFFLGKDLLAKVLIEQGAVFATGLKLSVERFHVNLGESSVRIEEMTLFNPLGFADKVMVRLPEIYVNFDPLPLLSGKVHLEEIRIHVTEFYVVRNREGVLNLDALKSVQEQNKGGRSAMSSSVPDIQIDHLDLRIGEVFLKDYESGPQPLVKEFPIHLHERYENITNLNALVSLIVVKALAKTTIAQLVRFDLGGLEEAARDTLAGARAVLDQASRAAHTASAFKSKAAGLFSKLPFGVSEKD